MRYLRNNEGYSLVEILVVVLVFSILSIITTQSLLNSLRTAKKSQNVNVVKENLEVAASTIERLIRNADDIKCEDVSRNPSSKEIFYKDQYGKRTNIRCISIGGIGAIASGSANVNLTSSRVDVNDNCSEVVFECIPPAVGVPPSVVVTLTGKEITTSGSTGAEAEVETKILLRSYEGR
jgi:prepilin-type N-terminal cleavage/methylation domain-containing protein